MLASPSRAMAHEDATYPMRLAARLSGVAPATIRAWERRYDAVEPDRTEGNARRYSAADVRRLVLLRKLTERGHTIAEVARLPDGRLAELIDDADRVVPARERAQEERRSPLLDDYLAAVDRFDARRAADVLGRAATLLPARELVFELLIPLVREIGEGWSRGEVTVAQEHLTSGHMRWLLSVVLRLEMPGEGLSRVVIATPPDERHELGALVAAFLAAARGFEPIYLAPDVPWADLTDAVERSGASLVVLSLVRDLDDGELRRVARGIERLSEAAEIWLGLPEDHRAARRKLAARTFHRFEDYDDALLASLA